MSMLRENPRGCWEANPKTPEQEWPRKEVKWANEMFKRRPRSADGALNWNRRMRRSKRRNTRHPSSSASTSCSGCGCGSGSSSCSGALQATAPDVWWMAARLSVIFISARSSNAPECPARPPFPGCSQIVLVLRFSLYSSCPLCCGCSRCPG